MGGSLVAGLRPEHTLSMSQRTWLKAKCWLGPAFAAKVNERGPSPNQHWVPGGSFFFGLSATRKLRGHPAPRRCSRRPGGRYTKAECQKSTMWAEAWWPAFGRNNLGAQAQVLGLAVRTTEGCICLTSVGALVGKADHRGVIVF